MEKWAQEWGNRVDRASSLGKEFLIGPDGSATGKEFDEGQLAPQQKQANSPPIPPVRFVSLCVLPQGGKQLAAEFQRETNFRCCLNAFLDPRGDAMPTYGQLGCSGFVVLEKGENSPPNGELVPRALETAAFLEYGPDVAFAHVNQMLERVVARRPCPPVYVGELVIIKELVNAQQYNGQTGMCIGMEASGGGGENKFCLQLLSKPHAGKQLKVRGRNLSNVSRGNLGERNADFAPALSDLAGTGWGRKKGGESCCGEGDCGAPEGDCGQPCQSSAS